MAQGGTSAKDAEKTDKATSWLDSHSAGTGPYVLTGWTRNQEVVLERNKGYWRAPAAFEKVILRHIADGAAQVLAIRRGDIDAALNLSPDQLETLAKDATLRIVAAPSLDYMYLTLTSGAELNATLAKKPARQAVAAAIDYDGIIRGLMGGHAIRPATFIPIGLGGSTETLTKEIGYRQDLATAKKLLAEAGVPNGFSFKLSYGKASIAGTTYDLVAQKIQSDLARVGITAELDPMDQATLRTAYKEGKSQAVLTFWGPDAMEPYLWAQPSIGRVSKRVRWTPPKDIVDLVTRAGGEPDPKKAAALYGEYQRMLVDQANYIMLIQPIYRVATSKAITGYQLTAAGWQVDLYDVKPAKLATWDKTARRAGRRVAGSDGASAHAIQPRSGWVCATSSSGWSPRRRWPWRPPSSSSWSPTPSRPIPSSPSWGTNSRPTRRLWPGSGPGGGWTARSTSNT
jgi:peptide/nickel transport system substrate-binding protein